MENFYDNKITNLYQKISKRSLFTFIFTFISCFLCNLFIYTNTLFVHDSTQVFNDSTGITNGRFLVSLFMPLFQRFSLPVLIGIAVSILIAVAVVFVVKCFDIKSKLLISILSLFIISHQSFIACHYYFSSAYIYAFSILMSVLSFYFISKYEDNKKKKIINVMLAIVCLMTSLFGYQAYISLYLSLCVIWLITEIINDNMKTRKQIFFNGIKYVGVAIVAILIYYCLWKVVLHFTNQQVVNYENYNYGNMSETIFGNLFGHIITAFVVGVRTMFDNYFSYTPVANICLILCNAFVIISSFIIKKKNGAKHSILLILMFLCLPLTICFIYLMSQDIFHTTMIFSAIAPMILLIKNLDTLPKIKFNKEKIKVVLLNSFIIFLTIISLSQVVSANVLYLKMKVNYNNSISYCTRLLDRIEQTEGVNENTKIILITDDFYINEYEPNEFWPKYTEDIPMSDSGLTYGDTFVWFITHNLNTNINICADNTYKYSIREDVIALDCFPKKNCMLWDNDTLLVKVGPTIKEIVDEEE